MSVRELGRSKPIVVGVLMSVVGFLVVPGPVGAQGAGQGTGQTLAKATATGTAAAPQPAPAAGGALAGFVYTGETRTPVAGAIVKLRNLADMREMASVPTDESGKYAIAGIPEGRYVLGVSAGIEDFNLEYALYIKSGELGKLSLEIGAGGGQGPGGKSYASAKKKGFFDTVAGRVLVVAALGVGLYFLLVEPEASAIR